MDQPPHDPGMEGRVDRLERDVADLKTVPGRLEPLILSMHAQMPHLATKAEIEALRGDMRAGFASKPGYGAMWSMGIALFAMTMAAISVGAIFLPLAAHALHIAP